MTAFLLTTSGLLAAIVVVALLLPCEACRLRRARMKQAYAEWQARQKTH